MGPHCRSLRVTLRLASTANTPTGADQEATWLLGHTERVSFGVPWEDSGDLYSDSVIHVPCRHLVDREDGSAGCQAHGFEGKAPRKRPVQDQPRQLGGDSFRVIDHGKMVVRELRIPPPPRRSLPVANGVNPCVGASCRTADLRQGAACCRDLQVEIMCTRGERKLEALVRHRKSPYLCKVKRDGDFSIDAELISACGYLGEDGVACSLHGRVRGDGQPAKPTMCSEWPPKREVVHPGCVLAAPKRRR